MILHNPDGGPEQIIHVREGFRFELYDGGYSQLKLVVLPWRYRGAAETPESRPRPDLRVKPREVRPLRTRRIQRAGTCLIEPLDNRKIDREARASELAAGRASNQAVLDKG